MCRLSRNPGALTSRTPQGNVGLFRGYFTLPTVCGHAVAQLVAALRFNPEGHGFDSQWGPWDFT
jgi:hypothetical protein